MTPTQFMPTFPCFSVFTEDCEGPYLVTAKGGAKALLVLTDEDLLQRLREQGEATGPTIRFEMAGQLLAIPGCPAERCHADRLSTPNVSSKAVIVSVAELYQKLLRSVESLRTARSKA